MVMMSEDDEVVRDIVAMIDGQAEVNRNEQGEGESRSAGPLGPTVYAPSGRCDVDLGR